MKIGAQFYTVRDYCKDLDSFAESLKKVADIGYTTVQISGVCEYSPEWLKAELKKNGLQCVITHTNGDQMVADPQKVARDHEIFGCKYIGIGGYGFDGEDVEIFKTKYSSVAEVFKNNGQYFMYHNHAHEFKKIGDQLMIEWLADAIPADQMGFTLDTYWVQYGGGDPAQWIEKLSGRVPCIHLKDMAYGQKMAPIGEGNINFDRVFEKAERAGTEYMLVEQDDSNGEDPFDCLRRSFDFLKAQGLK